MKRRSVIGFYANEHRKNFDSMESALAHHRALGHWVAVTPGASRSTGAFVWKTQALAEKFGEAAALGRLVPERAADLVEFFS
jgi:hypothetical protein